MIMTNNAAIISYLYCIINSVKLLVDTEPDAVVPDVALPLVEVVLPVVVVVFVVEVEP